jgi:ABC-type nitrate/sulfonate/bicarbonate transport system substrate-binding protein
LCAVVACFALAAVVAACGDDGSDTNSGTSGSKEALRKFTVVLDWTPNTNHSGMYVAAAQGLYRDAGLDVRFVEPGQSTSLQLLAAGKADVAVSVAEEVLPARAQGLPVQSVAAVIEHNTSSLISLAADGITRPRDLEGKTYAGYGGQLEQALLDKLVACDGGDPKKVKVVDVGEADYRIGLERNQYDAVWIFDGWDKIRLADIDGLAVSTIPFIEHTDCIPDWYTPVLAASTRTETKRAADLKAFLAATAEGYRSAMTDPSAAAHDLLAAAPDLDRDLVERSAKYLSTRYAEDPGRWGQQKAAVWSGFAAFLHDAGLIEKPLDPADAWTNEFLPASP